MDFSTQNAANGNGRGRRTATSNFYEIPDNPTTHGVAGSVARMLPVM
jgi:hypothetical protein